MKQFFNRIAILVVMAIAGLSPQIARAQDYTEVKKDGITYRIQGDSAIVYSADKDIKTANILSEVNGVPVTTIGMEAFMDHTGLTTLNFPNSVTRIEAYAFSNCDGLTKVIIPDNVVYIGGYAFYECSNITSVTIGEDSKSKCKTLR